jgi:actin-related protein
MQWIPQPCVGLFAGSSCCRVGQAGDDAPRAVFAPDVGHPVPCCKLPKSVFVGDEAAGAFEDRLSVRSCVDRGVISDWNDFESLIRHCYLYEMRVDPSERPALFSEVPNGSKARRGKLAELMFETFSVPSLYVQNSAVLAIYASGRTTGPSALHACPRVSSRFGAEPRSL